MPNINPTFMRLDSVNEVALECAIDIGEMIIS